MQLYKNMHGIKKIVSFLFFLFIRLYLLQVFFLNSPFLVSCVSSLPPSSMLPKNCLHSFVFFLIVIVSVSLDLFLNCDGVVCFFEITNQKNNILKYCYQ